MQLHISSLRHFTLLQGKGLKEFIKVKVGSRRISYKMLFYSLLFCTFLLKFLFVLTSLDGIDGENNCSTVGCLGKKIGPKILGRSPDPESNIPEIIYKTLDEPLSKDELQGRSDIPQTLEEFMIEMKEGGYDAKTFAVKLREMVTLMEQRTRMAKIHKYLYRHLASNSIPKQLHCLTLRLANEHSNNAGARLQLPYAELVPALVDNSYFHFILASDNVLAASVVAKSLIRNCLRSQKVVLHIITDKKTYYPMQAWFSKHRVSPGIIEVKALHHFDWLTKGKVPGLEATEKDQKVRSQFRGGSSTIVSNTIEKPNVTAAKLQALGPKYSVMNHIRIHLPELFPSLNKVVFLDDDIVVQTDLTPLWDIDMNGKVNGAVETCSGNDKFVMPKRLKSYLNFSHPLISENFDPNECAWAYGMNIFDLEAWRKTDISLSYYYWIEQVYPTIIPPRLIAFHDHVHFIDPFWHMLGLGYQENINFEDAERAGVIHFNGRAKPWLELAFPHLRPLWTKYVHFSDKFIKSCHIRA